MIRMKIRKSRLKGAVALGLVAAMTLGNGMLAEAAELVDGTHKVNQAETNDAVKADNDSQTVDTGDVSVNDYLNALGQTQNTSVTINSASSYVISIPKTIYIADTNSVGAGGQLATAGASTVRPYVQVTKANMPKGVKLTITAAQIALTSKYSHGDSNKKLDAFFETTNGLDANTATAVTAESKSRAWDAVSGANACDFTSGDGHKAYVNLYNVADQTLRAGQWTGTLTFTIAASQN